MKATETFTINIEPIGENRLQVTVPEIGASTVIASAKRDAAVDAAHQLILAHLLRVREQEPAKAS